MNYTLGSIVTIDNEDYKIVPPRNLTALCDGCDFKGQHECEAPARVPCAFPSRTYVKVTELYREPRRTVLSALKDIINH